MQHLPHGSALHRAADPEGAAWTFEMQLQATQIDELRYLRFALMRALGASKEKRPPDPIPRPGVTPPEDKEVFGRGSAMPLDDMAEWLDDRFVNLGL